MIAVPHRRRHVEISARAHRRALIVVGVLLALALYPPGAPTRAHTGTAIPILTDDVAGPYGVELWVNPEIAETTFWLMVPEATAPAEALSVTLTLTPVDGHAEARTIPAVWEPSPGVPDEHRYEAITALDAPGAWAVTVSIEGPDGAGEARATFEALPEGPTSYEGWVSVLPFALLGLLVVGGYWASRRRRAGSAG